MKKKYLNLEKKRTYKISRDYTEQKGFNIKNKSGKKTKKRRRKTKTYKKKRYNKK